MSASTVRVLRVIADAEQTDAELLGRFIDRRDEAAFALLVRRHGAMVYGVCRRVLPDHDAEDAFQAVFLVLAEKARTIVPREAVGNWLYGVARKAALLSRRSIARRREQMGDVPERPASQSDELRATLDEELSRLPDAYRTVIVLCDLEGRTRREAAVILGWPEGTVAGRLVRARELLAKRLAPSVSIAALIAGTASARVPDVLAASATRVASAPVAALTNEVLGAMARGKLMKAATVLLLLGCVGFGMVLHAGQPDAPKGAPIPGPAPMNPPKADDVAWGKEVDGLQIGLVASSRTCRVGEKVKLEVKVRNVGKAEAKITYSLLEESAPQVTADVRMTVAMPPPKDYFPVPVQRVVKPGETIALYKPELAVESPDRLRLGGELRVDTPTTYLAPGKYKIGYGGMIRSHPKLITGMVEFEVKESKPFTAWGKEIGGLQAGLSVSDKRVYRLGETVTLVVRVRNIGKETVKFEYIKQYLDENPPGATGADGKSIPQVTSGVTGVAHVPVEVSLEPGKEVVLGTRIHGTSGVPYELRPAGGGGTPTTQNHPLKVGTGKVTLQYEKVFGNSSIGKIKIDPELANLATGKLELEVADAQKGPLYLPTNQGFRELKGKELEAYEATNAWLEERYKEAQSIKAGSTYADICKYFRSDGGLTQVGKHRFVNILCPLMKIDVEFEPVKGDTLPPTAKVTKVSRPYFEREFAD